MNLRVRRFFPGNQPKGELLNIKAASPSTGAELRTDLNRVPESVRHIHLMGICGTGMAALAGLLKEQGARVTGSDRNVYPPMSDFLEALSIPVLPGYRAENLAPPPDLVIVGNVITRDNPEAVELARLAIPYISMPQALRHYAIAECRSIVVAGTHGKTTTTALASWVLEVAGLDPGFLIGGLPGNFATGFRRAKGAFFVIEGDEYDSAFFDKGPKFLHYAPWVALLTSIEFDHADIYRDLDHVLSSFRAFVAQLPPGGLLIANADDPRVAQEARQAPCPVVRYGLREPADWSISGMHFQGPDTHLEIRPPGGPAIPVVTPLYGRHNMSNLLAVAALSGHLGIPTERFQEALRGFSGVRRRQEVRGEAGGVLVIDDFAHHPTAVRETIGAVRERYADRRLVAVFEPRSNSSRRSIFQSSYAEAFDLADLILIAEPPRMEGIPPEERFSSPRLVDDLRRRNLDALFGGPSETLLEGLLERIQPGDAVLIMSNGGFGNLQDHLLKRLRERG